MVESQFTTTWFEQLRAGDSLPAQQAWQCYYERLIALARNRLRGARQEMADAEDVVVVAFNSFLRGVEAGRFPVLSDRDDLWQVLVMLTARKAIDQRQYENREKRGGQVTRPMADLGSESGDALIAGVIGREPTPAFAAEVAEQLERFLAALGDPTLVQIATGKLEGYANQELAEQLGCGLRTIERKLALIRAVWEQESPA
ncbi:MAG: ECF-type sigma factor [Pirellulaceae bacterium]